MDEQVTPKGKKFEENSKPKNQKDTIINRVASPESMRSMQHNLDASE